MKRTKIDWCDYTWNPIIGCNHGCKYCYARKWAKRAGQSFLPHRAKDWTKPYKIKEPSKIFVCSLADLFGNWMESDIIREVLTICVDNPQHEFMFLTKNPRRYQYFEFSKNCWLGVTITGTEDHWSQQDMYDNLITADIENDCTLKLFVSIEPLLGEINFDNTNWDKTIDLVIVGAQTMPNVKPEKEWIDSVKHRNIYYKENIREYL